MGRQGVCIAYTWPSGFGGPFGYFHDRESGEYTVLHLKQFLRGWPIVRMSSGFTSSRTAAEPTSLQRRGESNIDCLRGQETRKVFKLQTLILASPDLDGDVFRERFLHENMGLAQQQPVIYFSPTDEVLAISNWLFSGEHRLGRLTVEDFTPEVRRMLTNFGRIEFIDCMVHGFSTSHDYEFAHPAVLSDLILGAARSKRTRRRKRPAAGFADRRALADQG